MKWHLLGLQAEFSRVGCIILSTHLFLGTATVWVDKWGVCCKTQARTRSNLSHSKRQLLFLSTAGSHVWWHLARRPPCLQLVPPRERYVTYVTVNNNHMYTSLGLRIDTRTCRATWFLVVDWLMQFEFCRALDDVRTCQRYEDEDTTTVMRVRQVDDVMTQLRSSPDLKLFNVYCFQTRKGFWTPTVQRRTCKCATNSHYMSGWLSVDDFWEYNFTCSRVNCTSCYYRYFNL